MLSTTLLSVPSALDPWLRPGYHWIAVLLFGLPILTYLQSCAQYFLSQVLRNKSRRPPQVPYYIPIIGNAFSMFFNTEKFLLRLQENLGQVPFQLQLGPKRLYYVAHGEQIRTLFARSNELLGTPLLLTALLKFFGMPREDIKIFEDDKSGYQPTPAPGFEHMDKNLRVHYGQRMEFLTFLQGTHLDIMSDNFADRLSRLFLEDTMITDDKWTYIPDLYDFMRRRLFRASVETTCGEYMYKICPTFNEDFWAYEGSIGALVKELPRWWAPQAYESREKMHDNLKMWYKHSSERFDWDADDSSIEYEPLFGSSLNRAMQRRYRAAGFTDTGKAANTLGFLIASNANEVPAVIWAILDIILTEGTISRVLSEISSAFSPGSTTPNITTLCSGPLMTSIFMETMRLRGAGSVARVCTVEKLPFGSWILPKDAVVMATSWLAGRDETFWNRGRRLPNNRYEHPLDCFWPERFLSYPNDPTSGPIRNPKHDLTEDSPPPAAASMATLEAGKMIDRQRSPEDDRRATVVTKGLSNHYFPFGGGVSMCPGRIFAKHEIITAIAITLNMYDIEPVDAQEAGKTRSNMTSFPFGSLGFDRKVPVRIRRRRLD